MGFVDKDDEKLFHVVLDITPGVLSSIYFVLFDIVLLALLDHCLARFVCTQYYKRIYNGQPISVRAVNIPGVTCNLLDSLLITPNVIALMCKLLVLGLIFYIGYDINTVLWEAEVEAERNGMFVFNGSDPQWGQSVSSEDAKGNIVYNANLLPAEIRWDEVRTCRVINDTANTITFYDIAVNVKGQKLRTEQELDNITTGNGSRVNDSSIVCMSPKYVTEPKVMAMVKGCSWLRSRDQCASIDKRTLSGEIIVPEMNSSVLYEVVGVFMNLPFFRLESEKVAEIWTEYTGANVTCATLELGPEGKEKKFLQCIVVAWNSTLKGTLVERWQYDYERQEVFLRYPGPVFEGQLHIDVVRMLLQLMYPKQDLNWDYFSSVVVADMSAIRIAPVRITTLGMITSVTYVSVWSVGVSGLLFVVVVISRIVVFFTFDRDDRPRFNCIDGLSSIVREEHESTGNSHTEGRTMMLGVSTDGDRVKQLHPIRMSGVMVATKSSSSAPERRNTTPHETIPGERTSVWEVV